MIPEKLKANTHYRREYESALEMAGVADAPSWEDLTDEQRENIRLECIRYQQELNAFGNTL